MGKKFGIVVLGLGAFVLVLGLLSKFYMYDRLAVVPLNQTTTSTSETLPGADAEYLDVDNDLTITNGPLRSVRVVTGDVDLSKEASDELDEDVAVWNSYVCTDTPDFDCSGTETPLAGSNDTVAFQRNSAETVRWDGAVSEASGETDEDPFEGLYFKFPFDTQKKTYQFWDGTLKKATPAEFEEETEIKGLKVYKFVQEIAPQKSGEITVPGNLVGRKASDSVKADRIYSNTRTLYVEPVTGAIIKGGESQDSYLEVDGERGATTTKATLEYTDDYVQENVDDYKSKAMLLSLINTTIPLVGIIGGLVLILIGALLYVRASRRREDADSAEYATV
ncbi:DUF3068 domain-containing protein [Aeromicrobium sp. 179-A 4D2 NHS]|uniref:DUF3068 domain-containing protein n=1 Tax=Aeromicrobium sp. 179-A 4D2 NHS TaxID=3142375 RepID=UPI0039A1E052